MSTLETPSWAPRAYAVYPFLEHADEEIREAFFSHARLMRVEAGQPMCFQGQHCKHQSEIAIAVIAASSTIPPLNISRRRLFCADETRRSLQPSLHSPR